MMRLSDEQQAVVHANFKDILLVKAYAGSGKSSTLVKYCEARKDKTFLYLVFNRSMKLSSKKSFKHLSNVKISTFNGIALSYMNNKIKERLGEEREIMPTDLFRYLHDITDEKKYHYASALKKLLGEFTASYYSMEEFILEKRKEKTEWSIRNSVPLVVLLKILPTLWNDILDGNHNLAFQHDFYLKLYQLGNPKLDYDYILVDESQDINPVMMDIVLSQVGKSKLIFVGDSYQSIYSWRGAIDSLEWIEKKMNPTVLYLSQSFRCPPKIATIADRIIKLAGAEKTFKGISLGKETKGHQKPTYIARTRSGVFDFCVQNLDKKIYFVGGKNSYNFDDILDIKNVITQKKEFIKNDFLKMFNNIKELIDYAQKTDDVSLKGLIGILFKYSDENIYTLVKNVKETAVSKESQADIIVTTAHKSKGLEWNNVSLLDDFPFKNKKSILKRKEALKEELHLLYVSVTRSKQSIYIPKDYMMTLYELEKEKMNYPVLKED